MRYGSLAVDTARVYAKGSSEAAFGQWLARSGRRDEMVVIGTGAHHDGQTLERRVTPAAIHDDIQISLDQMQLETIDVYVLHKDDPEEEQAAGRINAFGGSGWTHERIAAANAYAAAHAVEGFTVSSPNLALGVPTEPMWLGCVSIAGDPAAQAWYARTRLPILAWSSQARGFFSGRFRPELTEGATTDAQNVIRTYFSADNWERYRRANVFALIGPATVAELDDSLGALDVELSADEVDWLNLGRS
jgi:aryl-alcohol dehydrogenase-like predicted oxidoreductase